jgi:hypothetical protein
MKENQERYDRLFFEFFTIIIVWWYLVKPKQNCKQYKLSREFEK